jgi:hypothetical protein
VIEWLTDGAPGTREQAIPGEWAVLVLIIVAGGVLGFLVLWFTMLRHERTVLHRARLRSQLEPELIGPSAAAMFSGTGHGALRELASIAGADDAGEGGERGEGDSADGEPEAEHEHEHEVEAGHDAETAPEAGSGSGSEPGSDTEIDGGTDTDTEADREDRPSEPADSASG